MANKFVTVGTVYASNEGHSARQRSGHLMEHMDAVYVRESVGFKSDEKTSRLLWSRCVRSKLSRKTELNFVLWEENLNALVS